MPLKLLFIESTSALVSLLFNNKFGEVTFLVLLLFFEWEMSQFVFFHPHHPFSAHLTSLYLPWISMRCMNSCTNQAKYFDGSALVGRQQGTNFPCLLMSVTPYFSSIIVIVNLWLCQSLEIFSFTI